MESDNLIFLGSLNLSGVFQKRFNLELSFTDKKADRMRPWINIDGKWILDSACFNVERLSVESSMEGATLLNPYFQTNPYDNGDAPYTDLLHERGALYSIQNSNDIRVVGCDRSMSHRLQKGWLPFWVRVERPPGGHGKDGDSKRNNDADGDHYVLHFLKNDDYDIPASFPSPLPRGGSPRSKEKKNKHLVTTVAPLDKNVNKRDGAIGFEFRVPDNCPREEMREVLQFICLIAASAVEDEAKELYQHTELVLDHIVSHRPINDKHWNEALVDVSTMGCFVPLSNEYTKKVTGHACFPGLSESVENKVNNSRAAFDTLSNLAKSLHRKYAKHPVYVALTGTSTTNPPSFVNRNFMAWKSALAHHPLMSQGKNNMQQNLQQIYKTLKKKGMSLHRSSIDKKIIKQSNKATDNDNDDLNTDGWKPDIFYLARFLQKN